MSRLIRIAQSEWPALRPAHPRPNKYRNRRTVVDGIEFDSKKEAHRYGELCLLRASGEVQMFLRQVPLRLPGKTKLVVDFLVHWRDGRITFEDTKSRATATLQAWRIKVRQLKELEGITITEL